MANVKDNRTQREFDSRSSSQRPKMWQQPDLLPEPDPMPGYVFRWVRVSTMNNPDPRNVSSKLREGWEPVAIQDQPKFKMFSSNKGEYAGLIEVGGLLLCKAHEQMREERTAYYRDRVVAQTRAVNENYMRENDPRMPMFNENKSKVVFGNGN